MVFENEHPLLASPDKSQCSNIERSSADEVYQAPVASYPVTCTRNSLVEKYIRILQNHIQTVYHRKREFHRRDLPELQRYSLSVFR